jgi:hypothetical protein
MPDAGARITDIEGLLTRMESAAKGKRRVTLNDLYEEVGSRSFGPLMLLAGLVTLAPLVGDIPGVPTTIGLVVILVSSQMALGRASFWLPSVLLNRSVSSAKLRKALSWLQRPAKFVDRLVRPRLKAMASGPATRVIACLCLLVGAAMPLMDFVPFTANVAGLALTAFGLSIIAHDGLLAIGAFVFTMLAVGLLLYRLL